MAIVLSVRKPTHADRAVTLDLIAACDKVKIP